jgi:hypothetical protein
MRKIFSLENLKIGRKNHPEELDVDGRVNRADLREMV